MPPELVSVAVFALNVAAGGAAAARARCASPAPFIAAFAGVWTSLIVLLAAAPLAYRGARYRGARQARIGRSEVDTIAAGGRAALARAAALGGCFAHVAALFWSQLGCLPLVGTVLAAHAVLLAIAMRN